MLFVDVWLVQRSMSCLTRPTVAQYAKTVPGTKSTTSEALQSNAGLLYSAAASMGAIMIYDAANRVVKVNVTS